VIDFTYFSLVIQENGLSNNNKHFLKKYMFMFSSATLLPLWILPQTWQLAFSDHEAWV